MKVLIVIAISAALAAFLVWASASIRSGVYLKALCRADTGQRVVFLTFDDGPVVGRTEKVLDVLKRRNAAALFFLTGENVGRNADLAKRIVSEGHSVGIHSWGHRWTFPFYGLDRMCDDLYRCISELELLTGKDVRLFRPPFGVVNPVMARAVKILNLKTVGWDVRSFDTVDLEKPGGREKVLARIMEKVRPGSVILLHDRLDGAEKLLDSLLDRLDGEGYRYDRPLIS